MSLRCPAAPRLRNAAADIRRAGWRVAVAVGAALAVLHGCGTQFPLAPEQHPYESDTIALGGYELARGVEGWIASPWEHEDIEGSTRVVPGEQPLVYTGGAEIFQREREAPFAYNPRFLPGTVTFDARNRPHIRVGVHGPHVLEDSYEGARHATMSAFNAWASSYVQTLDHEGHWIVQSVQPDPVRSGQFVDYERVVFDAAGAAYQLVHRRTASGAASFLLASADGLGTWQTHELPAEYHYQRIESAEPGAGVVVVAAGNDGSLAILRSIWRQSDGIAVRGPFEVANHTFGAIRPYLAPPHSGGGKVSVTVVTRGGLEITYLVFLNRLEDPAVPAGETAQYVVAFDHEAELALNPTNPVLLGSTLNHTDPPTVDVHNGPAIVVDSEGRLHVVLGSHQRHLKHTCTRGSARRRPVLSSDDWLPARAIHGGVAYEDVGATYVGLVIDSKDTLHVVTRGHPYHLTYFRAQRHPAARALDQWFWESPNHLINHLRSAYGIYYHKLTMDQSDRLFVSYSYLALRLTPEEEQVYRSRWPREVTEAGEIDHHAHDPVLMMSADEGNTWHLATTEDLLDGVVQHHAHGSPADPLEPP